MGLLRADDWQAHWIAAETPEERAQREHPGRWVGAPADTGRRRAFRLPFDSDAGELQLLIQSHGMLLNLCLDGVALTPEPDSLIFNGVTPPARVEVPVTAGRHMLSVEVMGFKRPPILAAQLQLPGGGWVTTGWGTRLDPPAGWQIADAKDEGWAPAEQSDPQPPFALPPGPGRLLRRGFDLAKPPRRARVYVAALGGCELFLNGSRIGDDTLQSEPMDYTKHVPYRVYDVAALLRPGENVIAASVADGFYASYWMTSGRYSYGPPPRRILVQLEMTDAAGQRTVLGTDEQWRSAGAALLQSQLYYGEDWDHRLDRPGWDAPGFDDSGWEQPALAPTPDGALVARIVAPIRTIRTLPPQTIRSTADRHIIDFGQNFAGRLRLRVSGDSGDRIVVRYAELVDDKGELDRRNLRHARAEDHYVLRGDPRGETLEPHFTYQGFRYVEVAGPKVLAAADVEGLVLSSDVGETGTLRLGQPILQKLWLNTLWSQRSNFMGVPTDCPQRDERVGWMGDAQVFWDTAAFNMDVGEFTRAYMISVRDGQGENGVFPIWAPNANPNILTRGEPTPGWSDAGVMLPFVAYQRYGDRQVVDENWRAMTRYIEGVLKDNPDGLWKTKRGADFGDWLALDSKRDGDETTPNVLIGTAMLARSVGQMAQMAAWTGRDEEARRWRARRAAIGEIFARTFVGPDGQVGNGSQSSYILSLAFDLVPPALRDEAAALLAADIRRRGVLLSTGFLGTPLALDVLADGGHVALAYELLLRTEFPSWGYMVKSGATTIWERWNGDKGDNGMNSFNHYALGAVCGFLFRRVAGLAPAEPGFARARIAPLPSATVGRAACQYDSVRGRFAVDWRLNGQRFSLDVLVPGNAVAEVRVPTSGEGPVTEGGSEVTVSRRVRILRREMDAVILEVGAGAYAFQSLAPPV